MKLYLIRHGDPDYANDTLTSRGHAEAKALVTYLQGEDISRIFSSPLGRARDTAHYTATALGIPAVEQPWMAELGIRAERNDGWHAAWDIPGHEIRNSAYLDDPESLGHIPTMPEDAVNEAVARIRGDSDHFLASLGYYRDGGVYRVTEASDERIAIFAHGGFGLTWLSTLLEIPTPIMWSGFFLHTSSVTQILFDQREPGLATPRCIMMSALPHLFAASLPPGQAGIRANYT